MLTHTVYQVAAIMGYRGNLGVCIQTDSGWIHPSTARPDCRIPVQCLPRASTSGRLHSSGYSPLYRAKAWRSVRPAHRSHDLGTHGFVLLYPKRLLG